MAGDGFCVRIWSVVTPSKYWATAIPLTFAPGARISSRERDVEQVLMMELRLSDCLNKMQKGSEKSHTFENKSELKPGVMVAVRHGSKDKHWYRGRLVAVKTVSPDTKDAFQQQIGLKVFATVFLVDYGYHLIDVHVRGCVRKLSKRWHRLPEHQAFQIVLKGLKPLSWEIDCDKGSDKTALGQSLGNKWGSAALDVAMAYWKSSKTKLAMLRNFKLDRLGRYHGELEMMGFDNRVVLNQVFIKMNLAAIEEHSRDFELNEIGGDTFDLTSSSLMSGSNLNSTKTSFLSICGGSGDPISEKLSANTSTAHSDTSSESGSEQVDEREILYPEIEKVDPNPLRYLDPNTGKIPNCYYNSSRKSSISACSSQSDVFPDQMFKTDLQTGEVVPLATSEINKAKVAPKRVLGKKLLQAYRTRCREKVTSVSSQNQNEASGSANTSISSIPSYWNTFRDDEMTLDDDDDDAIGKPKSMYIPAGVDTGKFLEEQLKRAPSQPVGPKRLNTIME